LPPDIGDEELAPKPPKGLSFLSPGFDDADPKGLPAPDFAGDDGELLDPPKPEKGFFPSFLPPDIGDEELAPKPPKGLSFLSPGFDDADPKGLPAPEFAAGEVLDPPKLENGLLAAGVPGEDDNIEEPPDPKGLFPVIAVGVD